MEITTTVGMILHRKGADVFSISPQDSVYDALSLMAKMNVGALPVIYHEKLVGMISERDYARKVILFGRGSRETKVADIMTHDVITAKPQDSVQDCLECMTDHRIRHLPVLDAGRVIGLVSIGDLVNWIINAQHAAIQDLESYLTGSYPA